jgi:hypothetical protein
MGVYEDLYSAAIQAPQPMLRNRNYERQLAFVKVNAPSMIDECDQALPSAFFRSLTQSGQTFSQPDFWSPQLRLL